MIVLACLNFGLALLDRVAEHYENSKLECSRVEEPSNNTLSWAYVEGFKSHCSFFIKTKLHSSKIEKIRKSYGFSCGIEVSSDGLRKDWHYVGGIIVTFSYVVTLLAI